MLWRGAVRMPTVGLSLSLLVLWLGAAMVQAQAVAGDGLLRTLEGHSGVVRSVAFSPDGRTVLSGSDDKTLKLWEVATGRLLLTFKGHSDGVTSVAFSPDGRTALSGSQDRTLKLWDIAAGRVLRTFKGHSDGVTSVAFSPDGFTVLSGSGGNGFGGTVKQWDLSTGKLVRTIKGQSGDVASIAVSPDGQTIISGSYIGCDGCGEPLKLWNIATGRLLHTFKGNSAGIMSVAFSPDGRSALSGDQDHTLKLWDITTGRLLRTFEGHFSTVTSVAFLPDGRTALSGSDDKTLKLWDIATGRVLRTFKGRSEGVYSVAASPDGRTALSGNLDETQNLWDLGLPDATPALAVTPSTSASPPLIPVPAPVAAVPATALPAAPSETRVALVIGNSAYAAVARLDNPGRDARAVADALRQTGFTKVIEASDLTREQLIAAVRSFAREADRADWAMVYFAGHGLEIGGVNYLIPVDARLLNSRDVQFEALPLDTLLAALDGARKLRLVVLDACRNNPFASQMKVASSGRSVGRGLGRVEPDPGTLVVYAAKDGQIAQDGDGTNSPFASALVKRLKSPGLEVRRLFDHVADDVSETTNKAQQPYTYGRLPGRDDFYFIPPVVASP